MGADRFFFFRFSAQLTQNAHPHLQVLKIEQKGDDFTYYVRYVDWPGHDAWVEHADMRCYDERTLSRHGVPTVPPGRSGAVLVALPQPDWATVVADAVEADWESELIAAAKRRKKRRDPPPPQPPTPVDVRLTPELVQVLVEDDAVLAGVGEDGGGGDAAAARLAPLPHHPTVDDVLQRYVEESAGARGAQKLSFEELVSGGVWGVRGGGFARSSLPATQLTPPLLSISSSFPTPCATTLTKPCPASSSTPASLGLRRPRPPRAPPRAPCGARATCCAWCTCCPPSCRGSWGPQGRRLHPMRGQGGTCATLWSGWRIAASGCPRGAPWATRSPVTATATTTASPPVAPAAAGAARRSGRGRGRR